MILKYSSWTHQVYIHVALNNTVYCEGYIIHLSYLYISKGVMMPSIPSAEVAMKLAVVGQFCVIYVL